MQEALAQDAAPMRIPFQTIPKAGLEEDVAMRRPSDSVEELWLQRERQFKVMAELVHRQAQASRTGPPARGTTAYGASDWVRLPEDAPSEQAQEPQTGSLF